MNKMVNVKGKAKLPLFIGSQLFSRGEEIDISITYEEYEATGKAFLLKMVDGFQPVIEEQRPIEEVNEEVEQEEVKEQAVLADEPQFEIQDVKPKRAAVKQTVKK